MRIKCEDCKHAVFERTKKRSLHPSGEGICAWSKTIRVAAAYNPHSQFGGYKSPTEKGYDPEKSTLVVGYDGARISRKRGEEKPPIGQTCPVFERVIR